MMDMWCPFLNKVCSEKQVAEQCRFWEDDIKACKIVSSLDKYLMNKLKAKRNGAEKEKQKLIAAVKKRQLEEEKKKKKRLANIKKQEPAEEKKKQKSKKEKKTEKKADIKKMKVIPRMAFGIKKKTVKK